MSLTNTQLISEHFSKAATRYDDAARLQIGVIERATQYLNLSTNTDLVDVGCGTANLVKFVKGRTYQGCDISAGMLETAKNKVITNSSYAHNFNQFNFNQVDAHNLPFEDNRFDVVFSSLAWQWCNLTKVLQQAYRVCKPGGKIVFTTLLSDTLTELRDAFSVIDSYKHVNQFITEDEAQKQIALAGICSDVFDVVNHTTQYKNVRALLKELKAIGANTVVNRTTQSALTKTKLSALENAYVRQQTDQITASWQTLYCVINKPI